MAKKEQETELPLAYCLNIPQVFIGVSLDELPDELKENCDGIMVATCPVLNRTVNVSVNVRNGNPQKATCLDPDCKNNLLNSNV